MRARKSSAPSLEENRFVATDLLAQFEQLVAKRGRFLEIEIGCKLFHLLLDLARHRHRDVARELVALELRCLGLIATDECENIANFLADGFGLDAVGEIVRDLFLATPFGFAERLRHRFRDHVGVHDDAPLDVARRATDGLDERRTAAQIAFFIRIENADE